MVTTTLALHAGVWAIVSHKFVLLSPTLPTHDLLSYTHRPSFLANRILTREHGVHRQRLGLSAESLNGGHSSASMFGDFNTGRGHYPAKGTDRTILLSKEKMEDIQCCIPHPAEIWFSKSLCGMSDVAITRSCCASGVQRLRLLLIVLV
jgi:hypothetical protein